jgi:hypothetical protein
MCVNLTIVIELKKNPCQCRFWPKLKVFEHVINFFSFLHKNLRKVQVSIETPYLIETCFLIIKKIFEYFLEPYNCS